ncbi:glycosyltransferase [Paenibacillus sp. NEAU-GSW1]|uniref:glycosyltransferase n=1 Tax=Paenibacillus sp. NEAU-GSW1 TaxID=2682486 RepID=UPI0012E2C4F8|nr:glycosyltransferase [Paenibacillus sp. NEAU-GSW1]MUT66516.1 glycosyltransferase [Paenibacillus sp. NEAU-GSW1]
MRFRFAHALVAIGVSVALTLPALTAHAADDRAVAGQQVAIDHSHSHQQCLSPKAVQLQNELRKLWAEHALWTKSYIVAALSNLESKNDVLARLLRNQQDIGNAIKPYYGEAAGNKLAELFTEHIVIAGKLIDALQSGNQAEVQKLNKQWYDNADAIAAFLSGANPNWSQKQLKEMLDQHLQLVTAEVAAGMKKDSAGAIQAFDQNLNHLMTLADTLAAGIVKQFPNHF